MRLASDARRQGFGIHLCDARVFHRAGVDLVAMRARAVGDQRNEHGLAGLQGNTLRERCHLAGLGVIGFNFDIGQRTMLAPDLCGDFRQPAIVTEPCFRHGDNDKVDIAAHDFLLGFSDFSI
jgi:hypothetical protein